MGRGRKGVMIQGNKKNAKRFGRIPNQDNQLIRDGVITTVNQTVVGLPEDVLNELRQMNPREVVNILFNM